MGGWTYRSTKRVIGVTSRPVQSLDVVIGVLSAPSHTAPSSGALNYGGVLTVTNLGPALQGGDSFQLFSAGSLSGAFTATNLPALNPGLAWSFNPSSGVLSVVQTRTRCQRDSVKLALVWEWKTAYAKPHHLLGQGPCGPRQR
jgi:hypothetical protein